jgi:hypothetical protein
MIGGMKTLSLLALVSVAACAEAKPVARTVNDVARQACEVAFSEQELPQGLSVKDLCKTHEDLQPFIRSILAAKQQVGAAHGVEQ